MNTECKPKQLEFQSLGRREVIGRFDGGRITSDGGGLLLREVDRCIGLLDRLADCFADYRNPESIEHSVRPRACFTRFDNSGSYGLALGYEDLNDHDGLRKDSTLALLVGKQDLTGEQRVREQDRGNPLAASSTLNRLELGTPESAASDRYKRIAADSEALDRLLVDLFLESQCKPPREIWLDLDATDDPLHGHQEGRFFHGYYRCYCYLPLYIFCGEHLLCARLRPADRDASAGSIDELQRIVGQIRTRWPKTRIVIRGDSGFCREAIMAWCEANDVGYVLGLARNKRLERALGKEMEAARMACERTGEAARRFGDFRYRTRKSWSCERRVIGKAEYLPGKANPRFVVTNLSPMRWVPNGYTKNSTVPVARWRTGSRSSNWSYCPIWCTGVGRPCNDRYSFAILEFHSLNHLGQQLVATEAPPLFLRSLHQLPGHRQSRHAIATVLGLRGPQTHRGKYRFDRVRRPDVLPVRRRKIVERQQRFLVFHQALHGLRLGLEALQRCRRPCRHPPRVSTHPNLEQRRLDLRLHRFRHLVQPFPSCAPSNAVEPWGHFLAMAFQKPRAPSPIASFGGIVSPWLSNCSMTSSQLASDSR